MPHSSLFHLPLPPCLATSPNEPYCTQCESNSYPAPFSVSAALLSELYPAQPRSIALLCSCAPPHPCTHAWKCSWGVVTCPRLMTVPPMAATPALAAATSVPALGRVSQPSMICEVQALPCEECHTNTVLMHHSCAVNSEHL